MPPRLTRRAALVALLLATSSLAGCGSDPAAPQPFADVAGTYMLQTVNGEACPRRESAASGTMSRAGDGTLILPFGTVVQQMGRVDSTGVLVLVESYAAPTQSPGHTFRFTRR